MVVNPGKTRYYSQFWHIITDNKYVSIFVIYPWLINYGIYGNNKRQSMLDLLNENSVLIYIRNTNKLF